MSNCKLNTDLIKINENKYSSSKKTRSFYLISFFMLHTFELKREYSFELFKQNLS